MGVGRTTVLMLVGDDAFGRPGGFRARAELIDPLETTLVAAESVGSDIDWLEPRDLPVDAMSMIVNDPTRLSISSSHRRGPAVLFADGAVFRLMPKCDASLLKAMITIDGGEGVVDVVRPEQLPLHPAESLSVQADLESAPVVLCITRMKPDV